MKREDDAGLRIIHETETGMGKGKGLIDIVKSRTEGLRRTDAREAWWVNCE